MRSMKPLLLGTVLALAAWSSGAAASVITYTLSGVADGTYQDGASTTPFYDVSVSINGTADPATISGFADGLYIYLTSAWLVAERVNRPIAMAPGALFFVGLNDTYKGIAFFGDTVDGTLNSRLGFAAPSLVGYPGATNFGPAAVSMQQVSPIALQDGSIVDFSQIRRATFAASVPEPSTWAMMLVGLFVLGGAARRPAQARPRKGQAWSSGPCPEPKPSGWAIASVV